MIQFIKVREKDELKKHMELDEVEVNQEFEQPEKLDLPVAKIAQIYAFYSELELRYD